jgi:hypothetical protein
MAAQYPDIPYDGPPKSYGKTSYPKRYIAIHNTSNDATDTGEADYAQRRTDGTSSHYYVDANSITQSLTTELGANHAGSTTGNRHAISYEITGVNGWSRARWMSSVAWSLLARQIARDCRKHGIVPQLLTVAQMQDGKATGIVTHDLMRRAWHGTTHTDPGPNFPLDHLLALVKAELDGGMTMADYGKYGKPKLITDAKLGDRPSDLLLAEMWTESHLGCGAYGTPPARGGLIARLDRIEDGQAASAAREQASAAREISAATSIDLLSAAVTALATGGGVDSAPILAEIHEVAGQIGELQAELDAANARADAAAQRAEAAEAHENQLLAQAYAAASTDPRPAG